MMEELENELAAENNDMVEESGDENKENKPPVELIHVQEWTTKLLDDLLTSPWDAKTLCWPEKYANEFVTALTETAFWKALHNDFITKSETKWGDIPEPVLKVIIQFLRMRLSYEAAKEKRKARSKDPIYSLRSKFRKQTKRIQHLELEQRKTYQAMAEHLSRTQAPSRRVRIALARNRPGSEECD